MSVEDCEFSEDLALKNSKQSTLQNTEKMLSVLNNTKNRLVVNDMMSKVVDTNTNTNITP